MKYLKDDVENLLIAVQSLRNEDGMYLAPRFGDVLTREFLEEIGLDEIDARRVKMEASK